MSIRTEALLQIGGFSKPSKMPCPSYSTPAAACQVGSKLRGTPGSTCADCYACKGCYLFRSTALATARRLDVVATALATPSAGARWVASFATALNTRRDAQRGWFRWHDAGDIQSATHLILIFRIARACPDVQFWLPTREYGFVREALAGEDCPPNLTIRLSAHYVDTPAKLPPALVGLPTSEVHTAAAPNTAATECIAYRQDGECRECRACWSADVQTISYPIH